MISFDISDKISLEVLSPIFQDAVVNKVKKKKKEKKTKQKTHKF